MSIVPTHAQFKENGAEIAAPPVLPMPASEPAPVRDNNVIQPTAYAQAYNMHLRYEVGADYGVIKGASTSSTRPGSEEHNKREQDGLNDLRAVSAAVHFGSGGTIGGLIDRLAGYITAPEISDWAHQEKVEAWDKHVEAGKQASVLPDDILMDPRTGRPATRAYKEMIERKGEICSAKYTAEDLLTDGSGHYVMDALNVHYNLREAHESMDRMLEKAGDMKEIERKLENGEIGFEDLNEEQQISLLAGKSLSARQALYDKAGIEADGRAIFESHIETHRLNNAPGALGDLSRSKPLIRVNDGEIIPGRLSQIHNSAALGMSAPEAQFAPLAPASAPPKQDLSFNGM